MSIDPLRYVAVLENVPYGSYVVVPPDLDERSKRVLRLLSSVLSGERSLNQLDLDFLGESKEDFVLLVRESIRKVPPKKLFTPSELLSIAEDLYEDLQVIGIEEPYVALKSVYDAYGLGDIEFALYDPAVEEVMINGEKNPPFVYHSRFGHLEAKLSFDLRRITLRLVKYLGRSSNILDGHLPDGSRVSVVLEPVSERGTSITIRKFRRMRLTLLDIIRNGTISLEAAAYLWFLLEGMGTVPHNVIVSGNTGGGKTTTLNALIDLLPLTERIITIEDTRELSLVHPNWVALTSEYNGTTLQDLLRGALRMRPDRIVVGEVRGPEAETLLAAMNVGHSGMGTLHANSARDTIRRLVSPPMSVPEEMLPVLNLIVVQHRLRIPGKGIVRRVTEIVELAPLEGGVNLATVFRWDPSTDRLERTDIPSTLIDRMSEYLNVSKSSVKKEIERRKEVLREALKSNLDRARFISLVNSYYVRLSGDKK